MTKRLFSRNSSKKTSKGGDSASAATSTKALPTLRQSGLILLASILLFLVALVVWYRSYYSRPSVVLWGAIDRALNTTGVVKRVVRSSDEGSTDVMSIARYDGEQGIQIRTALSQKTPPPEGGEPVDVSATAESLGIPAGDYQRYIEVPKNGVPDQQKVIFEQIVGKWVKTGEGGLGKPGQLYVDNMLGSIPFGNLTSSQRKEMIQFGRSGTDKIQPIFTVDYNSVKKISKNGRPTYTFELAVRPDSYAKWYQQYFAFMGFQQFADEQYSAPVANALGISEDSKIILEIDVISRQIRSINRSGGTASPGGFPIETIYSYGVVPELKAPADSLSTEQFQEIITKATGTGGDEAAGSTEAGSGNAGGTDPGAGAGTGETGGEAQQPVQ